MRKHFDKISYQYEIENECEEEIKLQEGSVASPTRYLSGSTNSKEVIAPNGSVNSNYSKSFK